MTANAEAAPAAGPAPSSLRETFELFAAYRPETGLAGLFEGIDLARVTPRQIYYAVHGRPPERLGYTVRPAGFLAKPRFVAALASKEFRDNIVKNLLDAFPERKRLLFLHIPRTAGSELSVRLMSRYPSISSQLTWPGWLTPEQFYAAVRDFVLEVGGSDSIFVRGHNAIDDFRAWRVMRFQDSVFAVLRNPLDMIISQVNYVMMRIFDTTVPLRPDTVGWRELFGVIDEDMPPSPSNMAALARIILRHSGVVTPNPICRFLGDGTAARAIENIVVHAIEITDIDHYDAWCSTRWDIDRQSRSNASTRYVALDDFTGDDRRYMASLTEEDARLYGAAQKAFARRGGTSLIGDDIL
jgi:hypothetical protein